MLTWYINFSSPASNFVLFLVVTSGQGLGRESTHWPLAGVWCLCSCSPAATHPSLLWLGGVGPGGIYSTYLMFGWLSGQESACSAGDTGGLGSIPGLGWSPGGGHGSPLQVALKNLMDRGAWGVTVHRVTKSRTCLKWLSTHVQW